MKKATSEQTTSGSGGGGYKSTPTKPKSNRVKVYATAFILFAALALVMFAFFA